MRGRPCGGHNGAVVQRWSVQVRVVAAVVLVLTRGAGEGRRNCGPDVKPPRFFFPFSSVAEEIALRCIDREPLVSLALQTTSAQLASHTRPFHHGFPLRRPPHLATTLPAPPADGPRAPSRAAPFLAPPRCAVLLSPCQRPPSTRGGSLRLRAPLQSAGPGPRRRAPPRSTVQRQRHPPRRRSTVASPRFPLRRTGRRRQEQEVAFLRPGLREADHGAARGGAGEGARPPAARRRRAHRLRLQRHPLGAGSRGGPRHGRRAVPRHARRPRRPVLRHRRAVPLPPGRARRGQARNRRDGGARVPPQRRHVLGRRGVPLQARTRHQGHGGVRRHARARVRADHPQLQQPRRRALLRRAAGGGARPPQQAQGLAHDARHLHLHHRARRVLQGRADGGGHGHLPRCNRDGPLADDIHLQRAPERALQGGEPAQGVRAAHGDVRQRRRLPARQDQLRDRADGAAPRRRDLSGVADVQADGARWVRGGRARAGHAGSGPVPAVRDGRVRPRRRQGGVREGGGFGPRAGVVHVLPDGAGAGARRRGGRSRGAPGGYGAQGVRAAEARLHGRGARAL